MSKQIRRLFFVLPLAAIFGAFAVPMAAHAQTAAPITEITVEHTRCFGTCPIYKVTLRHDGAATFVGTAYVSKIGTYKAYFGGFDRLARAIQAHGFQQLKAEYTQSITDQSHTITTVVSGGKRKSVDNYADSGPQPLWEIQAMIDGTVAEMQWKKVSSKRHDP